MTDGTQSRARAARRARAGGRCHWVPQDDALYVRYHDEEWGRPVHDDRRLFEMLILEGAQAGLSWSTILHKRAGYRRAFANFDPRKVARFDARRRAALRRDPGIVRNRLKIDVHGHQCPGLSGRAARIRLLRPLPVVLRRGPPARQPPARRRAARRARALSDRLSKDLLKRGFRFVGIDHHLRLPAGGRAW